MAYYSYDYYETHKFYPQETHSNFPQDHLYRPAPAAYMKPQDQTYNTPGNMYLLQSEATDVNTVTVYQAAKDPSPYAHDNSDPFAPILPSSFPPGTEPRLIEAFNRIDRNGDGVIDDRELQSVLSSFTSFDLRTVHLLMYIYTNSNARKIGPREFVPLYKSMQNWKAVFQRSDVDRNGRIDAAELRGAMGSLGYNVPPTVLSLLISKFDKNKGNFSIGFDNFIECCLTVKGLTEKFKAKANSYNNTASFTYDEFLLAVLPFVIA